MTISRREHLLSLAGLGVLAGCASDETSSESTSPPSQADQSTSNPDQSDSNPDTASTEGEEPAETTEEASVEISAADFVIGDSVTAPPDGQIPWGRTEVRNTSSVPHGRVRTELRFYDSNDTFLEMREGYTPYLPADTVWRDYLRYYTEAPDRVEYVKARTFDDDPIVDGRVIDDVTIISSEMNADPEGGVELSTEIDLNGASPDRATIIGLFYDDQDCPVSSI